MKKIGKTALSGVLFFSFFAMTPHVQAEGRDKEKEVIVVYKNNSGKEAVMEQADSVEHVYRKLPAAAVTADEKTVRKLEHDPDVLYVENNAPVKAADATAFKAVSSGTEQNTGSFAQWNIKPIQADLAWHKGLTGKHVRTAVLDSGISPHDELSIAGGVSMVDYTASYRDDNGHGTHVAGIIGAKHNGFGIDGIAPGAELYAVKVLDKTGSGDLKSILKAIDWSIQHNIDIINMSLVVSGDSQILHDAADRAYKKGILLVAASGNDGNKTSVYYPAAYSSVIAVSATNEKNQLASFSNTGAAVEFSAPGTSIISTYVNRKYASSSGTSQAVPHVAGMFALLKQMYPASTNSELRRKMQFFTSDLGAPGRDSLFGYGLIRFKEADAQLEKAQKAVAKAEKSKKRADIDKAQNTINPLPANVDKTNLRKRLNSVENQLKKTAESKVKLAEKQKKKAHADAAQTAVNELDKGPVKTNLQKRINAVRSNLLTTARNAVARAEKTASDTKISKAQKAINELLAGNDKTKLQKRLDNVKKKAAAYTQKVKTAKAKVKTAEQRRTKKTKSAAQSAVNKLKASAEKTKLQKRLNAIKLK
ncbi:S8 family serine peptidase [Bacillus sp. HSf4]|uniref:S8 family peptidase n=1 Tax=Bacillus sp. HSf4 TaxID=3035514 RepID=UPI00240A63A6|nr:S8 family serine peptidase [Bacillus sp. HSf4]WFA06374.1 S8 family serine peptidase [Bacillus sp. HSf4]